MRIKVFNKARSGCFVHLKSDDCPERSWWLEMPKGALLHTHKLNATVDINFMLNRIHEQEALYLRTPAPVIYASHYETLI